MATPPKEPPGGLPREPAPDELPPENPPQDLPPQHDPPPERAPLEFPPDSLPGEDAKIIRYRAIRIPGPRSSTRAARRIASSMRKAARRIRAAAAPKSSFAVFSPPASKRGSGRLR